ncbi:bone morphogenetic protein 1-like [Saccoglossus kowalevskii]
MVLKPGSTLYIQSPNYPGDYYSNSECLWKVRTESGLSITINFRDFQTEKGFDWLDIGDGDDATDLTSRIRHESGHEVPIPVYVEDDKVWIKFTSDDTINYRGFLLMLVERNDTDTSEPKPDPGVTPSPPPPCGDDIIVPEDGIVNITSPNYPEDYDNNLNCEWTIRSTTGRRIRVTFQDFESEKR